MERKKIFSRDLLCTGLNQLWRMVSGSVTMMMIPLYLSPETQGYWYMFTSLAALAVFADLGFSNIILQFAAHEFAYLRFKEDGSIDGDAEHLKRLAGFFRFSMKWLGIVTGVVFPMIVFGGYVYLFGRKSAVAWELPWLVYSVGSGMVFVYSSVLYFFEGCNSVAEVQLIRFKIACLTSLSMILGLYFQMGLYALAISMAISAMTGLLLLWMNFRRQMVRLWKISRESSYAWFKEFFSLLWRYAVSWCSGYLIFQLFTPLAFHFYGAVEAGKVGLSISLWTAAMNIANIWLVAITPQLNVLIARKEWIKLDNVFFGGLISAVFTFLVGTMLFYGIYFAMNDDFFIFNRLIGLKSMMILSLGWLFQVLVSGFAVYLRAHKVEPLMYISLLSAIYISFTTFLCSKYLKIDYFFLGFLTSYIFGLPYVAYVFFRQKKKHYNFRC